MAATFLTSNRNVREAVAQLASPFRTFQSLSAGLNMNWQRLGVVLLAHVSALPAALADGKPVRHRIMVVEYGAGEKNRLIEVSEEGRITWEHRPPSLCVHCQPLPNGHVVYAFGGSPTGVLEVDREQRVVWNYVSQCEQILTCERLATGLTLAAEQGPCRVAAIDAQGKTAWSIDIPAQAKAAHNQMRCIHALENGNVLVANEADGVVREVSRDGRLVWECPAGKDVHEALRLKNGNTLIGCGTDKRVIEVTPEKKIVWELKADDVPDVNLTWVTGLQLLDNGHIVVGNFLRGQEGKGAHAFEVTRDKQVVWQFADHALVKLATNVKVLEETRE